MIVGRCVDDRNIERQHSDTRLIKGRVFICHVDLVAEVTNARDYKKGGARCTMFGRGLFGYAFS